MARWQHPRLGLLTPGKFIGLLFENGKIYDFDIYLFEESCKKLQDFYEKGKNYCLSTNFTRVSISAFDFIERIESILAHYQFTRKNLIIEITEDTVEKNKKEALKNMRAVKNLGFSIALDDLGSGFSFFSDLKDYPLDYIKMDRDMVATEDDLKGRTLTRCLIDTCKTLGMKVICEGIENKEQRDMVKEMGCDYIQGYYYYKALPPEEAEKYMN